MAGIGRAWTELSVRPAPAEVDGLGTGVSAAPLEELPDEPVDAEGAGYSGLSPDGSGAPADTRSDGAPATTREPGAGGTTTLGWPAPLDWLLDWLLPAAVSPTAVSDRSPVVGPAWVPDERGAARSAGVGRCAVADGCRAAEGCLGWVWRSAAGESGRTAGFPAERDTTGGDTTGGAITGGGGITGTEGCRRW